MSRTDRQENPATSGAGAPAHRRSEAGQASLVALLIGVALIAVLVWVFLIRPANRETQADQDARGAIVGTDKRTTPGASLDQAKGVECANNLRQCRLAIQMERETGEEGKLPPTLTGVSGITPSIASCPANGRPYLYNPQTGVVQCTTPGHQQL
ncbi:MAG: hypothetical protein KY468_05060 [Armatimonadetes bacterium]|nr:hypothetical protein [Armatimonadota bacterium]